MPTFVQTFLMMIKAKYLGILFAILTLACSQTKEPEPVNIDGFEVVRLPGTAVDRVEKKHETGNAEEQGYLMDGKRHGLWTTLNPRDGRVTSITHYINGLKDGLYLKFSNREQVELKAYYKNDVLHGPYVELQFGGRPSKEATYADGVLDGVYKEYYQSGKLLKEIEFKEGKQDGIYRYYDEQGAVTIEYQYKNGEKVGGGMVD